MAALLADRVADKVAGALMKAGFDREFAHTLLSAFKEQIDVLCCPASSLSDTGLGKSWLPLHYFLPTGMIYNGCSPSGRLRTLVICSSEKAPTVTAPSPSAVA